MSNQTVVLYRLSADSLATVRARLEAAGCNVLPVEDADSCLAQLMANPNSWVVFNGDTMAHELLPAIKSVAAKPTVHALVLGTSTDPDRIAEIIAAGASDYVVLDSAGAYPDRIVTRVSQEPPASTHNAEDVLTANVDRLLHALEHDLRNPVGNILGYVDLLRDRVTGDLTAEQREFLVRIEDNCTTLLALLDRFSALSERIARISHHES